MSWLFPEKDFISKYQTVKKQRYDFGIVELNLELKNDEILSLKITGDFFGEKPVEKLEDLFKNVKLCNVERVLDKICVSNYILGMANNEFASLIFK